jgi:hypothetical protein
MLETSDGCNHKQETAASFFQVLLLGFNSKALRQQARRGKPKNAPGW